MQTTIEQIDIVKRWAPATRATCDGLHRRRHRAHAQGRDASPRLIGVEGGHQIDNSLRGAARLVRARRALHDADPHHQHAWADSATDNPVHHGLTPFGKEVVREMNRLGMLVDLSHVSAETMRAALERQRGAGDLLAFLGARAGRSSAQRARRRAARWSAKNGGVVMVNFAPATSPRRGAAGTPTAPRSRRATTARRSAACTSASRTAPRPPLGGLGRGAPEAARDARAGRRPHRAHPQGRRRRPRRARLGLRRHPRGARRASKASTSIPALLAELARRGWSDADLAKVAGGNVLRVLAKAEEVARASTRRAGPRRPRSHSSTGRRPPHPTSQSAICSPAKVTPFAGVPDCVARVACREGRRPSRPID